MQAKTTILSYYKQYNRSRGLIALLFVVLLTACTAGSPTPITSVPTLPDDQSYQTRHLHLPTLTAGQACPRQLARSVTERYGPAIGNGPVYAAGFEPSGALTFVDPAPAYSLFTGSDWNGAKVLWIIDPTYSGPVFIRGGRIDQPGELRFDQALPLATNITIDAAASHDARYWRDRPSFTRFQSAGCYAYQVDGQHFSYTIVFEAEAIAE